ncbi:MAG: prepilin-type N-terminal cleavage/methylation domain-containing protein [Verrucomicrobiota bacterium]|nr:prepilin-type N-terminal cleavage/methylation domain-containing protein [Verrucomicrobiota bacterium]
MDYLSNNLKHKRSSSSKAFTLVELLAVVAIMLLILKLTLPTLDGLLGKNGKGMARGQLIGDLNRARLLALQKGEPVYVVFMPLYSRVGFSSQKQNKSVYFKSNTATNALLGKQLTGYAIYSGDRPGVRTANWHSDWKTLPEGFSFDSSTLDALPHSVTVNFLKPPRGVANTFEVTLPALKYNSRGVLEGAGLGGVYLSVSKGGVFPPGLGAAGKYLPKNADWPEPQPVDDRQWLHVNGVTGRAGVVELTESEVEAGKTISDKIVVSGWNVYITHSPILPSDLERELRAIVTGFDHDNSYQPNWLDSTLNEWVPNGQHYPIPGGRDEKLNPIFKNIPRAKALELGEDLMKLGRYASQGGIRVWVDSAR